MTTRTSVLISVLAVLAAAGGITLVLASDHDDSKVATIALAAPVGLAFIMSGLIARARRPANRVGTLMVLVGFTWFVGALAESNHSLVFTLGLAFGSVSLGFLVHLLLAFPSGRLVHRRIAAAAYALALLAGPLLLLFDDLDESECEGCPDNAFLVSANDGAENAMEGVVAASALVLVTTVVVVLVRRWRRATRPLRRALAPVFLTGGAALLVLAALLVASPLSAGVAGVLYWVLLTLLLTVPLSFLYGLLRTRLARAGVGRLLIEVPEEPSLEQAQEGLRRALGDPMLRLAYWLPESEGYVDTEGRPFELPPDTETCVTTRIEYEDRPVAALVHDASLRDEPELLDEVIAAARIGLEKDRSMQALRQSEARNRALLNAIPDLMFRIASDGTYLDFKVDDESNLLTPASEVIGRTVRDRLPAHVADRVVAGIARALDDGTVQTFEYELDFAGKHRHYEGRIVRSGEDEVLFIVREITERKRQERELEALHRELEARLEELHASRARIVEAGDAERRRIERNLHDGAQQRLASLSLSLRLAQAKVRSDPEAVEALLRNVGEELSRALAELRELAHGIHPAVLTDHGLAPAIESLAARSPVPVEVEGPTDRLPPSIETAAYYVVSEALANATKHAGASEVVVRVARDDGYALVEVRDNGVGGANPAGSGLRGLADRVSALGGRLDVESAPGTGTRVRATIPVAESQEAAA